MAAPDETYGDEYGLPHEERAQWGADAEQKRQLNATKTFNPSANKFVTQAGAPVNPSVKPRAQTPTQPVQAQAPLPAPPPMIHPGNSQMQLGRNVRRGFGPASGLGPSEQQKPPAYFGNTAQYFKHLSSMPGASPEIQWFAKMAQQQEEE